MGDIAGVLVVRESPRVVAKEVFGRSFELEVWNHYLFFEILHVWAGITARVVTLKFVDGLLLENAPTRQKRRFNEERPPDRTDKVFGNDKLLEGRVLQSPFLIEVVICALRIVSLQ